MLWGAGAAAGVVILLVGFSIRSLVMLFVETRQAGVAAVAEEMRDAGADNGEQGTSNCEQEAASVTAPSSAPADQVYPPQASSEFVVDYQALRERESGRKEMIETLREIAQKNPESGYAMTEEQRRKFEQSSASFQ